MKIELPELSLVVLVGPSGSGKSSFAKAHFMSTEVVSSDVCRGLVSDDENDQSASRDAFDLVRFLIDKRLKNGLLTVVDATSVRPEDRKQLLDLARSHHVLPVAVAFDLPIAVCAERNAERPDRQFGPHVVRNQQRSMRSVSRGRGGRALQQALRKEKFTRTYVLESEEEVQGAEVVRRPMWSDRKSEHGPFDIIGDVHGCLDELVRLIEALGYRIQPGASGLSGDFEVEPPADAPDRKLVFVGDLVDRGPASPGVLRLVMGLVKAGKAYLVPGNHDAKLVRQLSGRNVRLTHGLAETVAQLEHETEAFREEVREFLDGLVSHLVFANGELVVAHAGLKESMQGRGSPRVRDFCLYGETTGEVDAFGLPVRHDWSAEYRGRAVVVYGHTPTIEAEWINGTMCVDTGCVFGGKLTALRYPEREVVSVPAAKVYWEPIRPLVPEEGVPVQPGQHSADRVLDLGDVFGKRLIDTALQRAITIREQHSAAALEAVSRFAVDPRWLVYLPPTMSPCGTSELPGRLEHPKEALDYFASQDVRSVVCEEKHMGSRAILVVCRDAEAAKQRFGVEDGKAGVVFTRTGRAFFQEDALEAELIGRVSAALGAAGLWAELNSDWVVLDCELMPWSAKAQILLQEQYASVAAAGEASTQAAVGALQELRSRGIEGADELLAAAQGRAASVTAFRGAYRGYCWPVASLADLKLAPFHILASEGAAHTDKDHRWHMETLSRLADYEPICIATRWREVVLRDQAAVDAAVAWWEEMTAAGGEGMVVKPMDFIQRGPKGLVQPAVKCRGPEYLRIIYGPDYDSPDNLERLRKRGLRTKRSLALREFALGVEALERLVRGEPLRRVHECVFAVLAMESEPVDPRL